MSVLQRSFKALLACTLTNACQMGSFADIVNHMSTNFSYIATHFWLLICFWATVVIRHITYGAVCAHEKGEA